MSGAVQELFVVDAGRRKAITSSNQANRLYRWKWEGDLAAAVVFPDRTSAMEAIETIPPRKERGDWQILSRDEVMALIGGAE